MTKRTTPPCTCGYVHPGRCKQNDAERLRSKTVDADGCWLWTGMRNGQGYGWAWHDGKNKAAHRAAYLTWVGPIPEGMQVDHLCHHEKDCHGGPSCQHRACINPAHLALVTPRENVLRGHGEASKNAAKTHCARGGHPLSGPNLYVCPRGRRQCRTCMAEAAARYASTKKE